MSDVDENFFDRADKHIQLSNDQLGNASMGKVSASMMYSVARFNAWVSFRGFNNRKEMEAAKDESFNYFIEEYKKMLKANIDDYIINFDQYKSKT